MLTVIERARVRALLTRLNTIPDGETVVANIRRGLAAGIVSADLARRVLTAWAERVWQEDRASLGAGQARVGGDTVLACTEIELMAAPARRSSTLWDQVRDSHPDPFRPMPGVPVSHVKDLGAVMDHLFGVREIYDEHEPDTPVPLVPSTSAKAMLEQTRTIEGEINRLRTTARLKPRARIGRRWWFWLTTCVAVEDVIGRAVAGAPGTPFDGHGHAHRVVDALGLVRFSQDMASKDVRRRWVVELRLRPGFATECAKPSFVFADHNPRFVSWTDPVAACEVLWGNAADLAHFHDNFDEQDALVKGAVELVAMCPDGLEGKDIDGFRVLGYLTVDRWGQGSEAARATGRFAALLREGQSQADVVALIMHHL